MAFTRSAVLLAEDSKQMIALCIQLKDACKNFKDNAPVQYIIQQISDLVRSLRRDDRAWRPVRFMAFDLPGDSGTFARRTLRLQALVASASSTHLEHIPQRHLTSRALIDARLQTVIAEGGEGYASWPSTCLATAPASPGAPFACRRWWTAPVRPTSSTSRSAT